MTDARFWRAWPLPLRWAVGISLAIHFCVILPVGLVMFSTPIAMPQAPLSAVLKGPGEVTHAASVKAPGFAPVSAGDTAKTSQQPLKPVMKRDEAQARPAAAPVTPTLAGTTQGDVSAQANAASRIGVVGGAPDSARDGVEADALSRYRLALGVEARKARRYPEASRTRGHEGTAEIFVVLSRSGGAPLVVAGRSSGSATLDDGALLMVRIAAERTPVPPELQGRNLRIPLRIRFSLDDF